MPGMPPPSGGPCSTCMYDPSGKNTTTFQTVPPEATPMAHAPTIGLGPVTLPSDDGPSPGTVTVRTSPDTPKTRFATPLRPDSPVSPLVSWSVVTLKAPL